MTWWWPLEFHIVPLIVINKRKTLNDGLKLSSGHCMLLNQFESLEIELDPTNYWHLLTSTDIYWPDCQVETVETFPAPWSLPERLEWLVVSRRNAIFAKAFVFEVIACLPIFILPSPVIITNDTFRPVANFLSRIARHALLTSTIHSVPDCATNTVIFLAAAADKIRSTPIAH